MGLSKIAKNTILAALKAMQELTTGKRGLLWKRGSSGMIACSKRQRGKFWRA